MDATKPGVLLLLGGVALAIGCFAASARSAPILYGLGFSPHVDGQGPGTPVSQSQIEDRLSVVAFPAQYVRTWGSRNGLELIPDTAATYGIPVAQCAYLDSSAADNEEEKANLIAAAVRGNVKWAVVGTEALVSGKVTEAQLIGHLQDVRNRLDAAGLSQIPVATAEPYGQWANAQPGGLFHRDANGNLVHAEVFRHVQALGTNLYPFHEGTAVEVAVQKLADMYQAVTAAVDSVVPGLPVLIAETGWPSAGNVNGQAVPSLENEEQYFRQVLDWSRKEGVPVFWFEAFDENWKDPGYASVERHWGLHYADGQGKFAVPEPATLCLLGLGTACFLIPRRTRLEVQATRCRSETPENSLGSTDSV